MADLNAGRRRCAPEIVGGEDDGERRAKSYDGVDDLDRIDVALRMVLKKAKSQTIHRSGVAGRSCRIHVLRFVVLGNAMSRISEWLL